MRGHPASSSRQQTSPHSSYSELPDLIISEVEDLGGSVNLRIMKCYNLSKKKKKKSKLYAGKMKPFCGPDSSCARPALVFEH